MTSLLQLRDERERWEDMRGTKTKTKTKKTMQKSVGNDEKWRVGKKGEREGGWKLERHTYEKS